MSYNQFTLISNDTSLNYLASNLVYHYEDHLHLLRKCDSFGDFTNMIIITYKGYEYGLILDFNPMYDKWRVNFIFDTIIEISHLSGLITRSIFNSISKQNYSINRGRWVTLYHDTSNALGRIWTTNDLQSAFNLYSLINIPL